MGKVVAALLAAVFIGMNLYSAEAADINLDGNTSEQIWDDSISGVLSPAGGDISYIGYRYIVDENQSRLYIAFQYVDDGGAASSRVILQLGGQSVTLAANNSTPNSCARYKGVLLGSSDAMIEAEITLDMRPIDSVSVTVYDSSGHSSGAHRITLEKPVKMETPTVKPTTTTPAQKNPNGGQPQSPQQDVIESEKDDGRNEENNGQNFDSNDILDTKPDLDENNVGADGETTSVNESESEISGEPVNSKSERRLGYIALSFVLILIGIGVACIAFGIRSKKKKGN